MPYMGLNVEFLTPDPVRESTRDSEAPLFRFAADSEKRH
jgi:hypothetical protein